MSIVDYEMLSNPATIQCTIQKECVDGEIFFLLQAEPDINEEFATIGSAIKWFREKCYWSTQITYFALTTDTPEQIGEDLATHSANWDQVDEHVYTFDTTGSEGLTAATSISDGAITALQMNYSNQLNNILANQLSEKYQQYLATAASASSVLEYKRILGMI